MSEEILIKTNVDGFYKTKNAVINNDKDALNAYKKRRQMFRDQVIQKEKFKNLENEVSEIKSMLKTIMEKLA